MSTKMKVQVSRTLDDKIKQLIDGQCDSCYATIEKAYILGFISGNSYNYVGLVRDLESHELGYVIMGITYLKSKPEASEIESDLQKLKARLTASNVSEEAHFDSFLVYYPDPSITLGFSRMIYSSLGGCTDNKVKVSVIDESKLISHSAFTKVSIALKLELRNESGSLAGREAIERVFSHAINLFQDQSEGLEIKLCNSKFSTRSFTTLKTSVEQLYDHLIPPRDAVSMGDYAPQGISKEEKQKNIKIMTDKWHNRYREKRGPLEFEISSDAMKNVDVDSSKHIGLNLTLFTYSHVNDTIPKTVRKFLELTRYNLELLRARLTEKFEELIQPDEIYFCSFKPRQLDHLVYEVYIIPKNRSVDYEHLENIRRELHHNLLAPTDRPMFRVSQRIMNLDCKSSDELKGLLTNVHSGILDKSGIKGGSRNIIKGTYTYHHYMQNNFNDSGWGCAYRSLQTLISWFKNEGFIYSPDVKPHSPNSESKAIHDIISRLYSECRVPSHEEIQAILVDVGDKTPDFIGTNKWIGSQEVCYVLDHLYGIQSKFIAVSSGSELVNKARDLGSHFASQSTPVMIGGGVLAHTILGTDFNEKNGDISYLILDPHYTEDEDLDKIVKKGWCGWKKNSFWDKYAFYNLCLPQCPNSV